MIKSKEDYLYYRECDKIALQRTRNKPRYDDYIWKYEIYLRKVEYIINCKKGFVVKLYIKLLNLRKNKLAVMLGYDIPVNSVGPGLALPHRGQVIINPACKIGENFRTHVGVNIGTKAGEFGKAPQIGNNVYIGPGAKIFGPIKIGNNVAIGANSVVTKDVPDNVTVVGVPAKIISKKGSNGFLIKATEIVER